MKTISTALAILPAAFAPAPGDLYTQVGTDPTPADLKHMDPATKAGGDEVPNPQKKRKAKANP